MADVDRERDRILSEGVDVADLDPDPVAQAQAWLDDAVALGIHEPSAVALATADASGRPSVRFVLLRGLAADGLRVYTNLSSPKAQDLDVNPWAAIDLVWTALGRQVRAEGPARRATAEDSDAYWSTRPRGSQLAARVSRQSRPVADRATMLDAVAAEAARWEGREVPRPDGWGGFVVVPDRWELWSQRPDRLHDRFTYTPDGAGGWVISRIWP